MTEPKSEWESLAALAQQRFSSKIGFERVITSECHTDFDGCRLKPILYYCQIDRGVCVDILDLVEHRILVKTEDPTSSPTPSQIFFQVVY